MTTRVRLRLAGGAVAAIALAALLAPLLAPYDPIEQLDLAGGRSLPPSWAHPLGTDSYSRDLLSRVLHGARLSLGIATLAVGLGVSLGTLAGLAAGWLGGWVDAVLMRFVDALLAVPRVFVVLMVLALWETAGITALVLILGLTGWPATARLVRAEVQSLRRRDFVQALEAVGVPPGRIVGAHVLPNALAPVIVTTALGVGQTVLLEAGLAYLGVGVRPPAPSWGGIIREGTQLLGAAPWIAAFAGVALVGTVTALSLLGDALRDHLDPRRP